MYQTGEFRFKYQQYDLHLNCNVDLNLIFTLLIPMALSEFAPNWWGPVMSLSQQHPLYSLITRTRRATSCLLSDTRLLQYSTGVHSTLTQDLWYGKHSHLYRAHVLRVTHPSMHLSVIKVLLSWRGDRVPVTTVWSVTLSLNCLKC